MDIDLSDLKLDFIEKSEIRKKADDFRKKYWKEKIPVDVELIAERNLNLFLTPIPGIKKITNSEAFLTGDLNEIIFDENVPGYRLRFSIAHEIGHLILHSQIIEKLRPNSYEDWAEILNKLPEVIWGRAEYQANEFAGRLLVPLESLIEELKLYKEKIEEAEKIIGRDILTVFEFIAPSLSKKFDVSGQVIKIRLEQENIDPFELT